MRFDGPAVVVAEIGSNHGNDFGRALESIRQAAEAGADAVKFQLFDPESLYRDSYAVARGRFQPLKLDWMPELSEEAARCGVSLGVSVFDTFNEDLLYHIGFLKLASRSFRDSYLHERVAEAAGDWRIPVLVSLPGSAEPGDLQRIYAGVRVVWLACAPRYPCAPWEAGVARVSELSGFGTAGYSDHTLSVYTGGVAVALGAKVLEKHFRLREETLAPDVGHSLTPGAFRDYVRFVRHVEDLLREPFPVWGEVRDPGSSGS